MPGSRLGKQENKKEASAAIAALSKLSGSPGDFSRLGKHAMVPLLLSGLAGVLSTRKGLDGIRHRRGHCLLWSARLQGSVAHGCPGMHRALLSPVSRRPFLSCWVRESRKPTEDHSHPACNQHERLEPGSLSMRRRCGRSSSSPAMQLLMRISSTAGGTSGRQGTMVLLATARAVSKQLSCMASGCQRLSTISRRVLRERCHKLPWKGIACTTSRPLPQFMDSLEHRHGKL